MKAHRRVIDTNRLIALWHGHGPSKKSVKSEATTVEATNAWLRRNPSDGIVTPVRHEFLGGTSGAEELRLAELFLGRFRLFDDGRVVEADWQVAERFAKRVRRRGKKRGAIDCLVLAICERLNLDVFSEDRGVQRH